MSDSHSTQPGPARIQRDMKPHEDSNKRIGQMLSDA